MNTYKMVDPAGRDEVEAPSESAPGEQSAQAKTLVSSVSKEDNTRP